MREQQAWLEGLAFFLHKYRSISTSTQPSELIMHSLLTNHAAVVVTDDKGYITDFNYGAERIFGYRREEIINRSITILLNEGDVHAHNQMLESYINSGQRHVLGNPRTILGKSKEGVILNLLCVLNELKANSLNLVYMFRDVHQVDDFFDEQTPEETDDQAVNVRKLYNLC
jgi:PAS domain S-box-containing protein